MRLTSLLNNLETININEQTNYRLMEIGKIKDYFNKEIQYQQSLRSKLGKHLTCLDYTDKILTVFLTVFSGTNIFARVRGRKQLLGLITSAFSLVFLVLLKHYNKKQNQERKNIADYCI